MLYNLMNDYTKEGRLLLKAANVMEERGHCKHEIVNEKGQVCLWGPCLQQQMLLNTMMIQ